MGIDILSTFTKVSLLHLCFCRLLNAGSIRLGTEQDGSVLVIKLHTVFAGQPVKVTAADILPELM